MSDNLIKQISIFAENKPRRVSKISNILSTAGIDIKAFTIAEAEEFGVIRMVVDNPEKVKKVLQKEGFTVIETEVIGVEMKDKPGGLNEIVDALGKNNINIEYAYASTSQTGKALLIFRINENDKAVQLLHSRGIKTISMQDIKQMYYKL